MIHWTSLASACKSLISVGIATLTTVLSSIAIASAKQQVNRTISFSRWFSPPNIGTYVPPRTRPRYLAGPESFPQPGSTPESSHDSPTGSGGFAVLPDGRGDEHGQ